MTLLMSIAKFLLCQHNTCNMSAAETLGYSRQIKVHWCIPENIMLDGLFRKCKINWFIPKNVKFSVLYKTMNVALVYSRKRNNHWLVPENVRLTGLFQKMQDKFTGLIQKFVTQNNIKSYPLNPVNQDCHSGLIECNTDSPEQSTKQLFYQSFTVFDLKKPTDELLWYFFYKKSHQFLFYKNCIFSLFVW